MASSAYASHTDVLGTAGYLRDPNSTANASIIDALCAVASRFIDEMLGQFFYDDGQYVQPLDGQGESIIDTPRPFFFSSGTIAACSAGATSLTFTSSPLAPAAPQANDKLTLDTGNTLREIVTIQSVSGASSPYTLTLSGTGTANAHASGTIATTLQIEIAYFENQPLSQRIVTLDGDFITPPTNAYAWPRFRDRIGAANQSAADNTNRWPWYGIEIAQIPISGTTYLPTTIPGRDTVRITAHWGWPVVPDAIKDMTCKLVVRLWRKRQAGEGDIGGSADAAGMGDLRELFDAMDEGNLLASRYKIFHI